MTSQLFPKTRKHYRRLFITSLMALQTAVVGTVISEFVMTQPQFSNARVALAQGNKVQAAEDSVVYIETNRGRGSGVVIDSHGLVVTNAHVVAGARQISVTVQGREMQAEVVAMGHAQCLDLALLQVEGAHDLPAIALGDVNDVYKTQTVYAIGYPYPLQGDSATITQGIVSNIHSNDGMIQLDGSLNPGNSGGAVVDDNANLVGIATSKLTTVDDINFAVSVDKVQAFVDAYRQGVSTVIGQSVMPGSQPDGGALVQTINLDGHKTEGRLQTGDSHYCGDGSLADLYSFEAQAGESVMLNMRSQDMGSFLFLIAPDGSIVAQSDVQDRNQAAIILEKLPQNGSYTVVANAAAPNQAGQYQLYATQPMLVESGAIYSSDRPCFDSGQRCLTYQFPASSQQAITLVLTAEFHPYVMLLDPTGETVAEGSVDPQTMTDLSLGQDGWYTLVISTHQPEDTGNFTVSVHDAETLNSTFQVAQQ